MDDRWDALFADIEAAQRAEDAHARRGELFEETAGLAAEHTLVDRLRGALGSRVQLRVGERDIDGTASFLGEDLLVVASAEVSIVALDAVLQLRMASRRHQREPHVLERLGFGSALRRLSAEREEISIDLRDGAGTFRGRCELVARDYVEISGRIVPFTAIAVIGASVDPFSRRGQ